MSSGLSSLQRIISKQPQEAANRTHARTDSATFPHRPYAPHVEAPGLRGSHVPTLRSHSTAQDTAALRAKFSVNPPGALPLQRSCIHKVQTLRARRSRPRTRQAHSPTR